jgi:hypothetical protein
MCLMTCASRGLARRTRAALLAVCLASSACSGSQTKVGDPGDLTDPGAARYRLPLRYNAVDPGQAFRCYGQCQSEKTPTGYLECLSHCPGFEVTQGVRCASTEVPPVAACFTVRQIPAQSEPDPGWVVLAVIANVALIVTLASVCASSSSQCGYGYAYPPGPLPY